MARKPRPIEFKIEPIHCCPQVAIGLVREIVQSASAAALRLCFPGGQTRQQILDYLEECERRGYEVYPSCPVHDEKGCCPGLAVPHPQKEVSNA